MNTPFEIRELFRIIVLSSRGTARQRWVLVCKSAYGWLREYWLDRAADLTAKKVTVSDLFNLAAMTDDVMLLRLACRAARVMPDQVNLTVAVRNQSVEVVQYHLQMLHGKVLSNFKTMQYTIFIEACKNSYQPLIDLTITPDNWPKDFRQDHTCVSKWCKGLEGVCSTPNHSQQAVGFFINACVARCGAAYYWNWGLRGAIDGNHVDIIEKLFEIYRRACVVNSRIYRRIGLDIDLYASLQRACDVGQHDTVATVYRECVRYFVTVSFRECLDRCIIADNPESLAFFLEHQMPVINLPQCVLDGKHPKIADRLASINHSPKTFRTNTIKCVCGRSFPYEHGSLAVGKKE